MTNSSRYRSALLARFSSIAGSSADRLPNKLRLALCLAVGGFLCCVAVARVLEPSPSGLGTHQQLGLPPCTFRLLFRTRCPSCGMTTSWALATRGRVIEAIETNSGGVLLLALGLVAAPWALASAALGRWWLGFPSDWTLIAIAVSVALVTLGDWLFRLKMS